MCFKLTIIMMLLVVMLRRIVIVIVMVVIVVIVSIAVIIAVVVIVIAIIVITTHNTNAVNRNRIKLKLIIADKRYFFSNELSVPTHRVLLEKWQVTVHIPSQRDILYDTMHVVDISFHLTYIL